MIFHYTWQGNISCPFLLEHTLTWWYVPLLSFWIPLLLFPWIQLWLSHNLYVTSFPPWIPISLHHMSPPLLLLNSTLTWSYFPSFPPGYTSHLVIRHLLFSWIPLSLGDMNPFHTRHHYPFVIFQNLFTWYYSDMVVCYFLSSKIALSLDHLLSYLHMYLTIILLTLIIILICINIICHLCCPLTVGQLYLSLHLNLTTTCSYSLLLDPICRYRAHT